MFANVMLRSQVYQQLKELILSGALRPGERLIERDLTNWLNVSRTPVREALNQLVSDGLVVHRPQRGHFVEAYDTSAVNDLYCVRSILEEYAIQLAVDRITDKDKEDFEKLKLLLRRYDGREKQLGDELSDTFRLHEMIARVARDQFLYETLTRLYERLQLFVWLDAFFEDDAVLTRREHAKLIDHIIAGETKAAQAVAREHVQRSHRNVVRAIARRPALVSLPKWLHR